ncbi:MAG: hypothetical protein DMF75_09415, partial [Acidobacteria bacterium]
MALELVAENHPTRNSHPSIQAVGVLLIRNEGTCGRYQTGSIFRLQFPLSIGEIVHVLSPLFTVIFKGLPPVLTVSDSFPAFSVNVSLVPVSLTPPLSTGISPGFAIFVLLSSLGVKKLVELITEMH